MRKSIDYSYFKKWFGILLGVFAIFAIKSIFENDNSKIVSKKGRNMLSDDSMMDDINIKIQNSEGTNSHKEIVL